MLSARRKNKGNDRHQTPIQLKKALIFGITGQDGSYLAELLLEKGYEVHGVIRKASAFNTQRIDHIYEQLHLHYGDVTDAMSVMDVILEVNPDELYNLSAQSQVLVSFVLPCYTSQVDAIGCLNILETLRKYSPHTKFYQASSSEMFGKVLETPQKETTPFNPVSPYAVAKVFAHQMVKNYREAYGLYAVSGILFNHESPRRGETFVTRKITKGLVDMYFGKLDFLTLGNLNSKRDWGHSKDYVNAMWLMLQNDKPKDYVVSSGVTISVREFLLKCFDYFSIRLEWQNDGINEIAIDEISLRKRVQTSHRYYRPNEVDLLLGDSTLIRNELGWHPYYDIDMLIEDMIKTEIESR